MKLNFLIASALILGTGGCASLPTSETAKPVVQLQCDDIETVLSTHGDAQYQIEFFNSREDTVDLFWINYEGDEELKHTLLPESRYGATTYITHPWVVRDKSGQCLALYNSDSTVVLDIR